MEIDVREDSLRKRYVFKLGAQLIGLGLSFLTAGLIPRTLGPALYGIYNYLVDFFDNFVRFISFGASSAFYNKVAHRQNDIGLVKFYLLFSITISIFLIFFIFFLLATSLDRFVLPDQVPKYIILALIWALFYIFNNNFTFQMMDGLGLTVDGEKIQLILRIFNTVALFGLFFIHQLSLVNLFISIYIIYLLNMIICWYIIIKKKYHFVGKKKHFVTHEKSYYLKEFYIYCYPLVLFNIFVFFSSFFERWFLQIIAGNAQQGFYSLSFRISQIYFLFTSSLTPLLMREFSIAFSKKDIKQMAHLFRRYIPLLYSITAYFACFICMQAPKIVFIFGGKSFSGAIIPVVFMSLYPIHQTYGQLSSSVFMATGKTKLIGFIGAFNIILGVLITYVLIAPHSFFGLDLGSTGLALKMLMVQFIGVNIQLYFNAKFLHLSFVKYLIHQLGVIAILLGIAFVVCNFINFFIPQIIISFLIAGIIYTAVVGIIVYLFPIVMGINKDDFVQLFKIIKKAQNKVFKIS